MTQREEKTPGIREIAAALGISLATVDRALHNRRGVNEKTRRLVLETARSLQYQPNLAARNLKLQRRLHVAVLTPSEASFFFDQVRQGIRFGMADLQGVSVDLSCHEFRRGSGDTTDFLGTRVEESIDALILTPGSKIAFAPLLRRMAVLGKLVVFVASAIRNGPHLASVTVDSEVSGGIVAELFARIFRSAATVVMMTGDLAVEDHTEKLRGFAANLAILAPHLRLLPTVETHDVPEEAFAATMHLVENGNSPDAIYVSTFNSLPVLQALERTGKLGSVQIVTTDLYPELVPYLHAGKVLASLHQRPYTQGRMAFSMVARHLLRSGQPICPVRLAPHIVLRSSLSLFTNAANELDEELT
jgi:LacI family transcriptional regulator